MNCFATCQQLNLSQLTTSCASVLGGFKGAFSNLERKPGIESTLNGRGGAFLFFFVGNGGGTSS